MKCNICGYRLPYGKVGMCALCKKCYDYRAANTERAVLTILLMVTVALAWCWFCGGTPK